MKNFDKNYMGHDLNDVEPGYIYYYTCKKCGCYISFEYGDSPAIWDEDNKLWIRNVISCDEMIIKSIVD